MRGFTLIETLIYIGLLSLLMTGVFSSVFVIIDANQNNQTIDADSVLLNKKLIQYE